MNHRIAIYPLVLYPASATTTIAEPFGGMINIQHERRERLHAEFSG
jgi:hypothetical protein